jgi:disulfide bond formation protein DsbB
MAAISLSMLILAHSVFQVWLYMAPCELCVYIRFAFFCIVFGGVIAAFNPKNVICKVIGYILAFWGGIEGVVFCLRLDKVHQAARTDYPFGIQGCSIEPTFALGLPLDKWLPGWFKPTGDCGLDNPIVPHGVILDGLQKFFVDFYADGWYLWPPSHFMNMAQVCMIILGAFLLILGAAAFSWLITLKKENFPSYTSRSN